VIKLLRPAAVVAVLSLCVCVNAASLPRQVSDKEFWTIVATFSESGGTFVSDNIISNEIEFQRVIPDVQRTVGRGVYLGVGPEQNFTYISAFKPSIAFIFDIRRGNLLLHLIYKALIELSGDRIEFLSRLFARKPSAGITHNSTARDLFEAFSRAPLSGNLAQDNLRAILNRLEQTHGFLLSEDDKRGISEVYRALYSGGPQIRGDFGGGSWIPSYAVLMAQTDLNGHDHSFLESERNFRILKTYESRNLIVPLVADFAGDKAILAVARYLKNYHASVTTFYASNVEEYLFKSGTAPKFYENVSALPIAEDAMFIRSFYTHTDAGLHTLIDPISKCLNAVTRSEVPSYADLISRSAEPSPAGTR